MQTIEKSSKYLIKSIIDFLLPKRCPVCEKIISSEGLVCGSCWSSLTYITPPLCACCGTPFTEMVDLPDLDTLLCARCLADKPYCDQLRSTFAYDDTSKKLILGFKHGDRTDLAPVLAHWMFRSHQEIFQSADFLIPVPLHWRRLLKRRYNQASLLSHALSKLSGVPTLNNALIRKVHTESQGKFTSHFRKKNVQDVFALQSKYVNLIKGKKIILIDDVLTTGATLNSCAKTLKKKGPVEVVGITFSRVVHTSKI